MTAERFLKENHSVYFWTLTFKNVYHDWMYGPKWYYILSALAGYGRFRRHALYPSLSGIKVPEVHPGGHGLHFHCLFNERVEMVVLKQVGEHVGLGHCWVQRVDKKNIEAVSRYMAKYLMKSEFKLSRGMRRWSTFGNFKPVRVRDVEIDSMFHRNMKHLFSGKQVEYRMMLAVKWSTQRYGMFCDWPENVKRVCVPRMPENIMPRKKLERAFLMCPARPLDEEDTSWLSFLNCADAYGWAKLNNERIVRLESCGECGMFHPVFERDLHRCKSQVLDVRINSRLQPASSHELYGSSRIYVMPNERFIK